MNAELKAKWLAALRSGDYTQVSEVLHLLDQDGCTTVGHCCLGVLCVVAAEPAKDMNSRGDAELDTENHGMVPVKFYGDNDGFLLSARQQQRFGLKDGVAMTLAQMNDDGKTFAEIADFIEENI